VPLELKLPGRIRLPGWLGRGGSVRKSRWAWLRPKFPPVAFELDTAALSMVRIGRRKQERFLASFDVEDVPPDLIEIDFHKARLTSQERYRSIVAKAIAKDPSRLRGISLVIPDVYTRVSIIPFEELPRSRQDTLDLIRFKTKKAVPFKVEEASLDYQVLNTGSEGHNILAVLTPRSVIEEFEAVFASFGLYPGLVELSTFSVVNAYHDVIASEMGPGSEFLVANVTGAYFSFAIFRDGNLLFFRTKAFAMGTGDDSSEGSLRLLKRELQTSLVYYREKLEGKGLARAYLRVVDLDPLVVSGIFSGEPEIESVAAIDARRVLTVNGRMSGENGDRTLQRILPSIGAAAGRSLP